MNHNQYVTRWLKEREAEIVVRPLQVNAVVTCRATIEEWRSRDKKATHIPIGSVVVEDTLGRVPGGGDAILYSNIRLPDEHSN